jgi:hypothetical protein
MLPENSSSAEQQTHPALRLIAARPDIFSHQGHVVATYRRKADAALGSEKVYGPYYHLNYRETPNRIPAFPPPPFPRRPVSSSSVPKAQ